MKPSSEKPADRLVREGRYFDNGNDSRASRAMGIEFYRGVTVANWGLVVWKYPNKSVKSIWKPKYRNMYGLRELDFSKFSLLLGKEKVERR